MTSRIPIVDLGPLVALTSDPVTWSPDDDIIRALSDDIIKAFTDIGFVYVINHGISQEMVDRTFSVTNTFFSLPAETKAKYARNYAANGNSNGWIGLGKERLDPEKLADYKEAYNLLLQNAKLWPDEEVPGFRAGLEAMQQACAHLARNVLMMMGIGLRLQEPDYFVKRHNTDQPSYTTLRSLYYPPIPTDMELGPGAVRCGEHSDFGSITLLFQDHSGGLEVKTREGHLVPATPIEGSVLINVGDAMQRWTADRLVSTRHRVLVPDDVALRGQLRRSMAYFVHSDDADIIRCIDNSDKYPPISSKDYTDMRLAEANKIK